ncbi:MAG: MFS transporter, partial [Nitrospiraceae bacterium]
MSSESFRSTHKSWLESFRVYQRPRVRSMLFLGFSAGLPYMLVFATLSRWLREAGIERSAIGFISWIMLAYAFKWVWAPFVDRLSIPVLTQKLGRRRSWMLLAQMSIMVSLTGMALSDPQQNLTQLVSFALLVAFASATQDIAIDAYRIEAVEEELQAAMAATYMIGYRLAMILSFAGALYIASFFDINETTYRYFSWQVSYLAMAMTMLVGIITTFVISEPEVTTDSGTLARERHMQEVIEGFKYIPSFIRKFIDWVYNAVISPFLDFLIRYRWQA